ncbi:glycerophosphodiester phosphodiesterase family protein [Propionibacterium australiense]|nr:glycerophosphodiester phosphodiesterase family protein [Propionibacterium australiense]RLP09999.1 hypothetical protein D9T14_05500 [Propionibacterium australiense]
MTMLEQLGATLRGKDLSLFGYRDDIPTILLYQGVSKAVLAAAMIGYRQLAGLLLWNLGRPAFTSGDLPYLMRSWQGWLLILLGIGALVIYTVFDINALILISERILHREKLQMFITLKKAFGRLRHFKSLPGALVIGYVSLLAPLVGTTFGISLTANFVIPEFITSVIDAHIISKIAYRAFLAVLVVVGLIHLFTFHYAILGDMDVRAAMKKARRTMRSHWKDFFARYLTFLGFGLLLGAGLVVVGYALPVLILRVLPVGRFAYHVGIIFFTVLLVVVMAVFGLLFLTFSMMKLTHLHESYATDEPPSYAAGAGRRRHVVLPGAICAALIVVLLVGLGTADDFDTNYPAVGDVAVIAHRGGGTLAHENTIRSLEAAIEKNATASEIDAQRTADGHYIINHDADFKRCCGVQRAPETMTLAEVRELRVADAQNPLAEKTGVATLEEMLDAAKGRIKLYIELKGRTADHQMVEDIHRMMVERDMLDECMLISLDYALVDHIETTHPEVETGYLCYFSFGGIEGLNCDVLLLEAETATASNVMKIHAAGKKVDVWTVNTVSAMTEFMTSDVDGIITDEVAQTGVVRQLLTERSDEARVLRRILQLAR